MEPISAPSEPKVTGVTKLDLEALICNSEKKLRYFIKKRVFDQADVDDLVQMTYLEAWCNRDKFVGASRQETWLFGIANNLVRNYFKTFYSRPQCSDLMDSELQRFEYGHDPSLLIECQCLLIRATEAMDGLSSDMRQVIDLVIEFDHSYQQAAKALGVPIGTVRSRLARARTQLKSSVYGDGGIT